MKISKCLITLIVVMFLTSSVNAGNNKPQGSNGGPQSGPSGLSPAPQTGTKSTPSPITQTPGVKQKSTNVPPPSSSPSTSNSTPKPTTPSTTKQNATSLSPAKQADLTNKNSTYKFDQASLTEYYAKKQQIDSYYNHKVSELNKTKSVMSQDQYNSKLKSISNDRDYKHSLNEATIKKQSQGHSPETTISSASGGSNPSTPSLPSGSSQPPITKSSSPITPLPKPPASANASGGNKQNWTFGDTLKWNESPEGKAWYKNLKEGISNMGQGRQQELDNLRKNYKDMQSKGLEAKYWDEYKKINERWDSINDDFLAKNQLPNSSNNYQGTQAPVPKIGTGLPTTQMNTTSQATTSKPIQFPDSVKPVSPNVPTPTVNKPLPISPDMLQSFNQTGSSKVKTSDNLSKKSSSALLPDKTETSSNNLPTDNVLKWQEEMFKRGYGVQMEIGRQFFYSPEYNVAIKGWQVLAETNPITAPLSKIVGGVNLLGKFFFAKSLEEQQMVALGGFATTVTPFLGELMGASQLAELGLLSKSTFYASDIAKLSTGQEVEGFGSDRWALVPKDR